MKPFAALPGRRNTTVLVVDDEPQNVELLEVLLEAAGIDTIAAYGGEEALDAYRRHAPDLVLLDLMMPGIDGFEVLSSLRCHQSERPVPVIVVTAVGDRASRVRAFELGASEFLDKPVDGQLVIRRVRTLLDLERTMTSLRETNAELVQLQAMQNELTAFLVHDLKNPLTAILANARWLSDKHKLDEHAQGALDDIESSAKRLGTLVSDILSVSRIDLGTETCLERRLVSLPEVVASLLRENSRVAEARHVALTADMPPEVEVWADADLLTRALENLVDNALRHTPRNGCICVGARRERQHVLLTVSNTGEPIPAVHRSRIFQKFQRVGPSEGDAHIGLGLYFCRRVADLHSGAIDVTSTDDWPVQFTLRLPDHHHIA